MPEIILTIIEGVLGLGIVAMLGYIVVQRIRGKK